MTNKRELAAALHLLAAAMLSVATEMEYYGGMIGEYGRELARAAIIARGWAEGLSEAVKSDGNE